MTHPLLHEIRHNPLLWLLVFVPAVFAAESLGPPSPTVLLLLSVLAIVPLAALLSRATESVAARTGDTIGGLLNATLGNLTELVIALTALTRASTCWSRRRLPGPSSPTACSCQIALFVAPVLVLLSYVMGPAPMDLQIWPGAVVMMLIAALTMALVTNSGRSAWFVGVLVLMVYLVFAMTLYLLPPSGRSAGDPVAAAHSAVDSQRSPK
jgi:Ca2+:H+ antiporter